MAAFANVRIGPPLDKYSRLHHSAHARELGHAGALYPWRTINGDEASAYYAAGIAAYHINADITYAIRKYAPATLDERFLLGGGVDVAVETARMWLSLGNFAERKGGPFASTM